jgi:hypothetical protein
LEPWLDDDKKKLKDNWATMQRRVKMIFKHMAVGNYE